MELHPNTQPQGDQYRFTSFQNQLPEVKELFCMIQMDNNLNGAVDTDEESELPTGLAANDIVRFNTEYDNAKYDCTFM